MDSTTFTKRITSGQPTKYDKHKHIALLYNVFSNCEGIATFCAEALISKKTFFRWLEAHKEFREGYDIALNIGGRKWEMLPLEMKNINYNYWMSIMRNRYGYGKSKFKLSSDRTPSKIIDSLFDGLEEGEITPHEAVQIANLALTKANIKANENVDNINQIKETRESLLKKIDMIQKVIDHAQHAQLN